MRLQQRAKFAKELGHTNFFLLRTRGGATPIVERLSAWTPRAPPVKPFWAREHAQDAAPAPRSTWGRARTICRCRGRTTHTVRRASSRSRDSDARVWNHAKLAGFRSSAFSKAVWQRDSALQLLLFGAQSNCFLILDGASGAQPTTARHLHRAHRADHGRSVHWGGLGDIRDYNRAHVSCLPARNLLESKVLN